MEICQQIQAFIEKDGDFEFAFTKLILRGQNQQYFYATTQDQNVASSPKDLDHLDKVPIPTENIWPTFPEHLSRAPTPLPSDCYVKEPDVLAHGESIESLQLSPKILHEAETCEILQQNPHPNIAVYMGCVVRDDRIMGLCFAKYDKSLHERLENPTPPLNKDRFVQGVEQGVQHLHSLGLVHNDINPTNIMVGDDDRPVIIDFDSCQKEGQRLGAKRGTRGWVPSGMKYARFANDIFGLSKLRTYIYAY